MGAGRGMKNLFRDGQNRLRVREGEGVGAERRFKRVAKRDNVCV